MPGNHDPDVSGYRTEPERPDAAGRAAGRPPWPDGAVNADGRVVDVAGLRMAGLGGCLRYRDGPNQYTQRQQTRRARRAGGAGRAGAWHGTAAASTCC